MRRTPLLIALLLAGCAGGTLPEAPTEAPTDAPLACADLQEEALTWFDPAPGASLDGSIELGQTQVVAPDDARSAPVTLAERQTLLLFTPSAAWAAEEDARVSAWDGGTLLGVVRMAPPAEGPGLLEQTLTVAELAPYSEDAWSAVLPWSWVDEGVVLRMGTADGVHEHTLRDLGAPSRFTMTRTKIVLFGEDSWDTTTEPAEKLAQDLFAATPTAELRWVDSLPWRLDDIVVQTASGPRLVSTEAERRALTEDEDHWSILKHQLALRHSLANTGRGLLQTVPSEGDNSPYSFGTSLGLGWFVDPEGIYQDIDDAPWAAGWTGWSAIWLSECGNTIAHEVGHSFTLAHFVEGTAQSWGIGDEYPLDGVHTEDHPWGYDATRNLLRTWYRVDGAGPVTDNGALVGKRDPMNGGEPPNGVTCYPQYTGFHAQKIQQWMEDSPTILEVDGVPGVYQWDGAEYVQVPAPNGAREPIAVDVPVVTFVGALGEDPDASRTYPPIRAASGNVFALPDPEDVTLPAAYTGATWVLAIETEDGTVEHALIARGDLVGTDFGLYSVNVAAEPPPVRVDLLRSPTGWPTVDVDGATLVHTLVLEEPEGPLPGVVTVGHGRVANGGLTLTNRCEPGINCGVRDATSTWRVADGQLHFTADGVDAPTDCLDHGAWTALAVPVVSDAGTATLTVHAQRVVRAGGSEIAVPINDHTPWLDAPDLEQSLRLWVPWEENAGLTEGRWSVDGAFTIAALRDGQEFASIPVTVDLEVLAAESVDLGSEWLSAELSTPESSMYFLVRDASVGPTERVWCGGEGPTVLRVPVVDGSGGVATLVVNAWQESCGSRWDLHAGRGADACTHRAVLQLADDNEDLTEGATWRTPRSAPLVIDGRRWHAPDARLLIGTFALDLEVTP